MNKKANSELSAEHADVLLTTLEKRFHQNMHRHPSILWEEVYKKLVLQPSKNWSLHQMEITGGKPDAVEFKEKSDNYFFIDCSAESPKERRSLCYDKKGLDARKEFKPKNTAVDLAHEMGVELLDEAQYQFLQSLEEFDLKTSSWLKTPTSIRELGGSIFGDRRFNHAFVYHNGASSYYGGRGFRAILKL